MLLNAAVVLVAVNRARYPVLPAIQGGAIGAGEMAVVGAAHLVFLAIDRGIAAFQIAGFAGGQLAALHSLGDAVLLILFALVDGGRGLRHRDGCGKGKKGGGKASESHHVGFSLSRMTDCDRADVVRLGERNPCSAKRVASNFLRRKVSGGRLRRAVWRRPVHLRSMGTSSGRISLASSWSPLAVGWMPSS